MEIVHRLHVVANIFLRRAITPISWTILHSAHEFLDVRGVRRDARKHSIADLYSRWKPERQSTKSR
jgi:hypothetical protein